MCQLSSIVNEVIRVILDFFILFYFFYEKILQTRKAQRRIQANKKDNIFMHIKSI